MTLLAHFLAFFLVVMLRASAANQACQPGFTGINCTIDIDDCLNENCSGHGDCSDRVDGYFCFCFAGFYGSNCEIDAGPCFPNPCKNSGTCTQHGDSFKCSCTAGHEGELCETVKPPIKFAVTLTLDRDYDSDYTDLTRAKTRAIIKDLGDIFTPFFIGKFSGFQDITFQEFFPGSLGVQFVITFQSTSNVNATSIIQALRRSNGTNELRFEILGTTLIVTEGSSFTTATPSTIPTESSELPTWVLVVIIAGAILFVLLVVIIILAVIYHRKQHNELVATDGEWNLRRTSQIKRNMPYWDQSS